MSEFSDTLETQILKSGLTENQLAKISGFTRSYIALMRNGQRLSPDVEKVKKLMDALRMTSKEYDALWNAYYKARYGESVWDLREMMISFLENFGMSSKLNIKSHFKHEIPDISVVDNSVDLEWMLKAVIEQEAQKDQGHLNMIIQGNFPFLYTILPSICKSNPNLKVNHIVYLEKGEYKNAIEEKYNLKMFESLLPMALSGERNQYNIFYHYNKAHSDSEETTLFPYVLITSEYVITMASDMSRGVISKNLEVLQLYERLFNERKRSCKPLLKVFKTDYEIILNYKGVHEKTGIMHQALEDQPCFAVLDAVLPMIDKYIPMSFTPTLKLVKDAVTFYGNVYRESDCIYSYFNKRGIEALIQDGLINEITSYLQTPVAIDMEDRLTLLKLVIDEIKTGKYKAYLLKEEKFILPKELTINAYSFTNVLMVYEYSYNKKSFAIQEQSLSNMIFEFVNELKNSPFVYTQEQTLAYLEEIYEQYKIK